jgi:hypothetical protein
VCVSVGARVNDCAALSFVAPACARGSGFEGNRLGGVVPALPFTQYTDHCGLQLSWCAKNHFACELPMFCWGVCGGGGWGCLVCIVAVAVLRRQRWVRVVGLRWLLGYWPVVLRCGVTVAFLLTPPVTLPLPRAPPAWRSVAGSGRMPQLRCVGER